MPEKADSNIPSNRRAGNGAKSEEVMATTLLLAEDDAPSREMYSRVLEAEGYHVIDVGNGEAALDVLQNKSVDLLLTDVSMPGMDGLELIERAREIQPQMRRVVMTGLKTDNTVIGAFRSKACDFLSKPFDLSELLDSIASAMKRDTACGIEIISDKPDWIELRVPCDLNA